MAAMYSAEEVFGTTNIVACIKRKKKKGPKRKKKRKIIYCLGLHPEVVLFYFTFFDLQESAGRAVSKSACGVC